MLGTSQSGGSKKGELIGVITPTLKNGNSKEGRYSQRMEKIQKETLNNPLQKKTRKKRKLGIKA